MDMDMDVVREYVQNLIDSVKPQLDSKSVSQTVHLLEHDEYEMALESILLDVMGLPVAPDLDYEEAMRYVRLLELDVESVFYDDFFERFENFCQSRTC